MKKIEKTICFDIKRYDRDFVYINRAALNKYSYSKHIGFSYWGDMPGYESTSFPKDDNYRYIYIIAAKDRTQGNIEVITHVTDNSRNAEEVFKEFKENQDKTSKFDYRLIPIPFECIVKDTSKEFEDNYIFVENEDLVNTIGQDDLLLYCPIEANAIHKVYGSAKKLPTGMYEFTPVQEEAHTLN